MSFGDGDLHVIVAQLKTENARLKQQLDLMPGIVRCRDCKWCMAYMSGTYCDYMAHAVAPDGFCAWAERKEGGDD